MRARGEGSLYPERRKGRALRWVVQVSLPDGRLHTMQLYLHIGDDMKRDAADRMQRALER